MTTRTTGTTRTTMNRSALALALAAAACNGSKDTTDGPTGDSGTPGETFTVLGDSANLPAAGLLSIWGSSDTDVFVVGADDGAGPVVLHWDGTAWSRLDTGTTGDLWWVWSDGGDTVWMSGENGRMLSYSRSGGAFTEQVITNAAYKLFGVWGSSATDVWTVGGDINNNNPGVVLHYDGTAWTESTTVAPLDNGTPRQAFKVWGSSASDVWVIGTGALVMHWDGTAWTTLTDMGDTSFRYVTVHGSAANDVWVVGGEGNAIVLHNDGTTWTFDSPPPADIVPEMNGVFSAGAGNTVMCGLNGSIYWRGDAGWEADPRPRATVRDFHACWIDDNGAVWAVGGDLTSLAEGAIVYGGDTVTPVAL